VSEVQQQDGIPDRLTLLAFTAAVLIGGMNFVGVRLSNRELPPLFGAGLRFVIAAAIFLGIMRLRRIPFPTGVTLFGTAVYGFLGFGVFYALAYWALDHPDVHAGMAAVIFASIPLITLLLVPLHGLERIRMRGIVGSLLVIGGITVLADPTGGSGIPMLRLVALVGAAIAVAESGVIIKRFPPSHPVSTNATGMAVGAVMLLATSALVGEPWALPEQATTWVAFSYLVVPGSLGLFALYLFTLSRWTASAVSYITALMPIPTMIAATIVLDEAITPNGVIGAVVVLSGVYVGALWRRRRRVAVPTGPQTNS
jgi:drug/metabolite transporter (DMT)-like permease